MELLYGTSTIHPLEPAVLLDHEDDADITFENVSVSYCLFETPMLAATSMLPSGVHPSVPSLLVATFWSVPDGPFGPFEFASVGISCRTGIKPRHLVCNSFIDNARAGKMLNRRYGFACRAARVNLREYYDRVSGSISMGDKTLLEIHSTGMIPLVGAGSFVKFSPALNYVGGDDEIKLAQTEASYEFVRVIRGSPQAQIFSGADLGVDSLRPVHPVSGAFAIVNLTLHPAKFLVSAAVPAECGGVTRITRTARITAAGSA